MGKRKRRETNDKALPLRSDTTPQAPQDDLQIQSELITSDQAKSSAAQSQASALDVLDTSQLPGRLSPLNQNHGSQRTIFLRHSRDPFGRHYSRRSFINHSDASPSNWKGTPVYDPKLFFKLENKNLLNFHYRDNINRLFQRPERIQASMLDVRKIECTICHKRPRTNPFKSENSISSRDLSVIAVLFCGHMYHADCLEQKTSHEDRHDPSCPQCKSHKQ